MRKLAEKDGKLVVGGQLVKKSEVSFSRAPVSLKRRCHSRLIYEALLLIERSGSGSLSKTELMRRVGLNCVQLKRFMKQLEKQELVRVTKNGQRSYLDLTEKGLRAINSGKEFLTQIGEL